MTLVSPGRSMAELHLIYLLYFNSVDLMVIFTGKILRGVWKSKTDCVFHMQHLQHILSKWIECLPVKTLGIHIGSLAHSLLVHNQFQEHKPSAAYPNNASRLWTWEKQKKPQNQRVVNPFVLMQSFCDSHTKPEPSSHHFSSTSPRNGNKTWLTKTESSEKD